MRNLTAALRDAGWAQPAFLSSGTAHDLPSKHPYWRPATGSAGEPDRFEIVNSGTLGPSHHSFGDPAQLSHPATEEAFLDFIEATGPYDVIHFHNIEGLPLRALRLKARFPQTRVVLSLHNYYPICPQVNLWRQESVTCRDFHGGAACVTCLPFQHSKRHLVLAHGLAARLSAIGLTPGTAGFDLAFRNVMRVGGRTARLVRRLRTRRAEPATPPPLDERAAHFAERRAEMVETLNAECDAILCVSEAVREIALAYGLSETLCQTDYIGTAQADHWNRTEPRAIAPDAPLRLAYLGHMRRDKGFFFLLDAFEDMPPQEAARFALTIAAPQGDAHAMARLKALGGKFADLRYLDGYNHDQLDGILSDVDAGLVPVLWHDNLPQVAIEMHARHIPVLTSDLGGAKELSGSDALTFPAGDSAAFFERLAAISSGQVDWAEYWAGAKAPVDMATHLRALRTIYESCLSARPVSP